MWNSDEYSPEMLLIRMCCQYALGCMEVSDGLSYLQTPLNETSFFKLLQKERVSLLVYQVLVTSFKAEVPSSLMERLSQKAKAILSEQLKLMTVERDVHKAFVAAAVPHVFLKGPALNQTLWGRRIIRFSNDLDLLVPPKSLLKADAVLNRLQFHSNVPRKKLSFYQSFYWWSTRKDVSYRRKGFSKRIELHWKTYCTELILKKNHAWQSSLDDKTYALYLCLHAAKHGWSRLIWLVDIIAFCQIKKLDIMALRAFAKLRHITPVVDEAILLADQWLGMTLVSDVTLEQLKKRSVLLQKRINWAQKTDLDTSIGGLILKRFFISRLCSNFFCQLRVWAQTFWQSTMTRLSRAP
ncbi:MAG: nucleotidyltransferase family protein [Gammaproteobacteria bacterium]|nr:nucleotidyltransferase family protein [Gammaproteobacteria bacterium]